MSFDDDNHHIQSILGDHSYCDTSCDSSSDARAQIKAEQSVDTSFGDNVCKLGNIEIAVKQETLDDSSEYIGVADIKNEIVGEEEISIKDEEGDTSCHQMSNFGQKDILEGHLLEDPSKVKKPFICGECNYQCKQKGKFARHLQLHKDISQMRMLKCTECDYQCRLEYTLQQHMKVHRDPSERHVEHNKDPAKVKIFDCYKCHYQCMRQYSLQYHLVAHHKSPMHREVQMSANQQQS